MSNTWRPSRRQVLISGGLMSGLCATGAWSLAGQSGLITRDRAGLAFGTTVKITAVHHESARLDAALEAAWAEIARVEEAASLFRPTSALSRLNSEGGLDDPPPALLEMLTQAQEVAHLTDGAFDVTVQPLWNLYATAFAAGRAPTDDELKLVREMVGYKHIAIETKRIKLLKPKMALTLNGIAQGYATERCLKALAGHGIKDAFLDTGEIGISGRRDSEHAWTTAIADPRREGAYAALTRPASGILATSGDYATAFTSDFATHHIFDPATLKSPAELASVSVLAQSGGLADALATAMMVMGRDRSMDLARKLAGVEVFLVAKTGERMRTPGFPVA